MANYTEIKDWLKEHPKELQIALCFILTFFAGFGLGKYKSSAVSEKKRQELLINYTKNQPQKQNGAGETTTGQEATKDCKIKGNISSTGKMTYHLPTGAFYKNTNPERCFNTEAEAKQAGFTKSSR
jgi:micrococcal nuclease